MSKAAVTAAILSFLFSLAACEQPEMAQVTETTQPAYRSISAIEAKTIWEEEETAIILDVRTEEEYWEKRIAGAYLIPEEEIIERVEKELPNKGVPILLYCRSGIRSLTVAQRLVELGYTRVYDFGSLLLSPFVMVSGPEQPLTDV